MASKKIPSGPMVPVTVIRSHGDEASGTAATPGTQANYKVTVIGPLKAIAVRFGHVFAVSLSTMIGANSFGIPILLVPDFRHAVYAAGAMAAGSLLKDIITIFGRLENKWPLATGNI
jgi:hypothetical protein